MEVVLSNETLKGLEGKTESMHVSPPKQSDVRRTTTSMIVSENNTNNYNTTIGYETRERNCVED